MTIENLQVLIADEGKWLTKGGVYSKKVYLGTLDTAANWKEITDEEKAAAEAESAAETEEDTEQAIISDTMVS